MKAKIVFPVLCGAAMVAANGWTAQKPQAKPAANKPAAKPAAAAAPKAAGSHADDEKALRKLADDFAKAYNARDAKALASQFAPQAEMVDLDGNVLQGREAIERSFAAQFENPVFKIAVEIESLRFVGDNLAVEDGHLTLTKEDDNTTLRSHAGRSLGARF